MELQLSISTSRFRFYHCKSNLASSFRRRRVRSTFTAVVPPVLACDRRSILRGGIPSCSLQQREQEVGGEEGGKQEGAKKVSAVLFDMDGVLCNSEEPSRLAAVDLFAEMGVSVVVEDFAPFTGTGEANFLGGVAKVKGVEGFDAKAAKKRFFEIYLDKYAKPDSGIGFPGALQLVTECKKKGLKVAVASSAERIKVNANLAAAGIPSSAFNAVISADAFENLKPAPDIFLAASLGLNVPPCECVVIEDAVAGVQAAKAAQMRCIAVTTTLSQEALQQAGPSLIRKEIRNISLHDILGLQASSNILFGENSSELKSATRDSNDGTVLSSTGLQVSRRDIVRYGSLGVALSCLFFTITNWKAMQYASPKGVLNALFGSGNAIIGQNQGKSQFARIQQIVKYISDLEARDAPYVSEFPAQLDWLNTTPLQFKRDLKGKVVLLDFWTYCCINCMHVLPDLEFLEKKYLEKPFVVVGVHSAKFDNEKDLEAIRNAVLRYNITHPVVNDGEMHLWRDLGVTSWPTFVLVGPNGKLLAEISGEGHQKDLDDLVEAALQFYDEKKLLNNKNIPLALEKDKGDRLLTSPLKFPGKLTVDGPNNRLFISDSNHNRIVVTDLEGNFILQVGSTGEGLQDGPFESATFNRPQGVAYNPQKNILYVADTENHALREVDFVNETVQTLAGNGTKGSDYIGGGKGMNQVLNSPWDVCFQPNNQIIYIAMAGQHQIWEHRILDGVTRVFSGDGYERNLNGSSSTSTSYAQPSGLTISPDNLEIYVADSESSSIRAINLGTGGSRLLAGGDPLFADNLFKFGDQDGVGSDALLQHPLGIFCGSDSQIYIADSYNHKVKKLDPLSRRVLTLAGTGTAGFKDASTLSSQLSEPAGIIGVGNGRFLIADTNNNAIRYLDLNEKIVELRTLELKGVPLPSPKFRSMKRLRRRPSSDMQIIKSEGSFSMDGGIYLKISVPEGYHFSKEASSKFDVEIEAQNAVTIEPSIGTLNSDGLASLHFRRFLPSPTMARINCKVYYCKEDEICLYQAIEFDVPFQQASQDVGPSDLRISYTVKPKSPTSPTVLAN